MGRRFSDVRFWTRPEATVTWLRYCGIAAKPSGKRETLLIKPWVREGACHYDIQYWSASPFSAYSVTFGRKIKNRS